MNLDEIIESTQGLPLAGYTVFWSLAGIAVERDVLKQMLDAAGFSRYTPDYVTYRTALRRALVEWISMRSRFGYRPVIKPDDESQDGALRRALIRVINQREAEFMVFALVAEDIDFSALGLSYGTKMRIRLHKKKGLLIMSTEAKGDIRAEDEAQSVRQQLNPYWERYKELLLSTDLSRMMRDIIGSMQAVSLRDKGGLYFVPVSQHDALERLRALLTSLPTAGNEHPDFFAMPVLDQEQVKHQMARAVHSGMMAEVAAMSMNLERFTQAKDGTVKPETVAERLVAYRRLREKAEVYADLLGLQQDAVVSAVNDLERQARRIVLSDTLVESDKPVESEKEVKKPDPVFRPDPILIGTGPVDEQYEQITLFDEDE